MAAVIFALLVQIEQALACGVMIDISGSFSTGDHCYQDETTDNPDSKSTHPCCDFSKALALKGSLCNDDHQTVIQKSSLEKINPADYPAFVIIDPPDVPSLSHLIALINIPDGSSSHPGTQTYLSTQRLRI